MEKEFQELIKKNLPQHVGEALKERLEQADKDAYALEKVREEVKNLLAQEDVFKETIKEYQKLDERNALLEEREKAITQVEINKEVEKLKYQLEAEKEKTEFTKSVTMGLVRNTEYRKDIFDSETSGQPYTDGQGYTHYPLPSTKMHTSTEKQE